MKLATVAWRSTTTAALVEGDRVLPVAALPGRESCHDVLPLIEHPLSPTEVQALRVREALEAGEVAWRPPILRTPKNIFCVGVNYRAHLSESTTVRASDEPTVGPIWFTKPATSLAGNGVPVTVAEGQDEVDFEGEVAAVIGRRCSGLSEAESLDAVFGYTLINDVSNRALQREREQWFLGKAADGHAPCGPCIVTADEIGDPQDLTLTTHVNGELRQSASTALMINEFSRLIADLSSVVTLEPGDIVAGGTPAGVGMADGRYLRPGDEVVVSVPAIGELRTPILARGTT